MIDCFECGSLFCLLGGGGSSSSCRNSSCCCCGRRCSSSNSSSSSSSSTLPAHNATNSNRSPIFYVQYLLRICGSNRQDAQSVFAHHFFSILMTSFSVFRPHIPHIHLRELETCFKPEIVALSTPVVAWTLQKKSLFRHRSFIECLNWFCRSSYLLGPLSTSYPAVCFATCRLQAARPPWLKLVHRLMMSRASSTIRYVTSKLSDSPMRLCC